MTKKKKKKKNLKNKAFVTGFVLVLFAVLILNDPFHTQLKETDVENYQAASIINANIPDTLKIMTWNIKFGGGRIDFFFDCYGDRVIMTNNEVIENLEELVTKIRQYDPDILFLQEVDINSKRSAGINQLQWILNHSALNYGVYASQWKASFIPSNGIGRMDSGNGILSKWPLRNSKRVGLPLFEDQNFIVRYFYLKRNILSTEIDLAGDSMILINTHLSAYSHDGTKKKQLDILYNLLDELDSEQLSFIMGGDLNCLPPGSGKVKDFPDAACEDEDFIADDYSEETRWMNPFYKFTPAISLEDYQADNDQYYKHTTQGPHNGGYWSRKIDYIFTNDIFVPKSGLTHMDESSGGINTMSLSDHAPISVEFVR